MKQRSFEFFRHHGLPPITPAGDTEHPRPQGTLELHLELKTPSPAGLACQEAGSW